MSNTRETYKTGGELAERALVAELAAEEEARANRRFAAWQRRVAAPLTGAEAHRASQLRAAGRLSERHPAEQSYAARDFAVVS